MLSEFFRNRATTELHPLQTPFERYDTNGDGMLGMEDLRRMFAELGYTVDDEYLAGVLQHFGDGSHDLQPEPEPEPDDDWRATGETAQANRVTCRPDLRPISRGTAVDASSSL